MFGASGRGVEHLTGTFLPIGILGLALVVAPLRPPALADEAPASSPRATPERPPVVLTDAALELHRSALVIDGHNDLPWQLRTKSDSGFDKLDISLPQPSLDTDLPRLRKGGVGAEFWSAYAPVETMRKGEAAKVTLEQIDLIRRLVARYPNDLEIALTADDIERIHRSGKIASLIGVEGGHAIENSLASLRRLYDLGARYMTLAHTDSLDWVDSATDVPRSDGLSPFGEEVVRTMNDLGMLVDISHISAEAMRDAIHTSRAPVIASHSSSFAVAPHPRNVPDDVLVELKKNGGVVMVNFYSGFIVPERAEIGARMVAERIARRTADAAARRRRRQRDLPFHPRTREAVRRHATHAGGPYRPHCQSGGRRPRRVGLGLRRRHEAAGAA